MAPDKIKFVAVAEPIDAKRKKFAKIHDIVEDNVYDDYKDVLEAKIEADIVLVCTQDKMHFEPTMLALDKGYNVLLEKPIVSKEECVLIADKVNESPGSLTICHVLRYTPPFFTKIKSLIDSGVIGDLISITHNENVGYHHAAHSYVRGNWRNEGLSSPMILAKSCHDIDILRWLVDSKCKKVSSFGSLKHFRKENAPPLGSSNRCINGCEIEAICPYSAKKIYMDETNDGWPVTVITNDLSEEGRLKALSEGPYGRCVYHCDNDVVDHQAVIMEFDNQVTVSFHMNSFTYDISRTIKICGSKGEIIGKMEDSDLQVYDYLTGKQEKIVIGEPILNDYGHGGGDYGLMESLVNHLREPDKNVMESSAHDAIESHLITFAIEESRVSGQVIVMDEYL